MGEALTVSDHAPPSDRQSVVADEAETDSEPMAMRWTIGRVLGVTVMVAIAAFWAVVFSGLPRRENPDWLDDRAFVTRTEERCLDLLADLKRLPNGAFITDHRERADVLDRATDRVEEMVDAIEADAPTTGDDHTSVSGWIADWRTYIENRRDYADRLREDPEARLLLDQSLGGDSVDKPIEIFAQVNEIPNCATPGDVG